MKTVVDTVPPSGSVLFPEPSSCHGPSAVPVILIDDFADVCDPDLVRAYDPPPGPGYEEHGDHQVMLTVTDGSGNSAEDSVTFTIDSVPPVVEILSPPDQTLLPQYGVSLSMAFLSHDDDGAEGDVVHEVVRLAGCTILDGNSYGNGDGLLSDENIDITQAEMCRVSELCGFDVLHQPELRVEATDCGGNVGFDSHTLRGSVMLVPGVCDQ